jgi:hypothetical protein
MKTYDLPIPVEGVFVDLCIDVLNHLRPNSLHQEFGVKGQKQSGIDIISFSDKSVYQCKWKSTNQTDVKKRAELIIAIDSDLNKIKSELDFDLSEIVFLSSHSNDVHIQTHVKKLSQKSKFSIEYWGWGTIQKFIQDSEYLMKKYYSNLKNLNECILEVANYLRKHHFEAHRGAILMYPGKTAIFGNDGYGPKRIAANDGEKRARQEVKSIRLKLKKMGINEIGFGRCSALQTWVLVVDSGDAKQLNDEIWNHYPEGRSRYSLSKTVDLLEQTIL